MPGPTNLSVNPVQKSDSKTFDNGTENGPRRVMFLYLGRRGIPHFVYQIASAAMAETDLETTISVSNQNEMIDRFQRFGERLHTVDTFSKNTGALLNIWRIPSIKRELEARIRRERIEVVIELMPHVWSPFIAAAIRKAGARYVTFVHDVKTHPGDFRVRWVKAALDWAPKRADMVFVMSEAVRGQLLKTGLSSNRIRKVFLPDLTFEIDQSEDKRKGSEYLSLLFLGRILPYKGLSLLLDSLNILRDQGVIVRLGVYGEGSLGENEKRLKDFNAAVVNNWLSDEEISKIIPQYDLMVLSHIEASQSGVAAIALGNNMPIVATPVGGLKEQIQHGVTGILAKRVDARALAEAIHKFVEDPSLCELMRRNISAAKNSRSNTAFVRACIDAIFESKDT